VRDFRGPDGEAAFVVGRAAKCVLYDATEQCGSFGVGTLQYDLNATTRVDGIDFGLSMRLKRLENHTHTKKPTNEHEIFNVLRNRINGFVRRIRWRFSPVRFRSLIFSLGIVSRVHSTCRHRRGSRFIRTRSKRANIGATRICSYVQILGFRSEVSSPLVLSTLKD